MMTRRSLVAGAFVTGGAAALRGQDARSGISFEVLRTPDYAAAYAVDGALRLARDGARWSGKGVSVRTEATGESLPVMVAAPGVQPMRIHLRWEGATAGELLLLGDAWERSYGDLRWQSIVPERVMPWYFLANWNGLTDGVGVETGAGALCFWQVDGQGVSLWLDVSNGGAGVELGERELRAATVRVRRGRRDETPTQAAQQFCKMLCATPRLAPGPIFGSNDWYYAYGKNSAETTLRDADLMAELAQGLGAKPYVVIDDGWKDGSERFPSMAKLAERVTGRGAIPGLWIRPLRAPDDADAGLLLPAARFGHGAAARAYDPTIPEAAERVFGKVRESRGWGYKLIKHDYSTYELLGKWGSEMGPSPTRAGWKLHDPSRTNAEVISELYAGLRKAAGDGVILVGCNTMGHLGAGFFEAQRTGDDTSGKVWERTRRMGVNTLAYRLPQHNTFFAVDADCVGITADVPWAMNRQFLDLIAQTGTTLFVSPEPAATGPEQRAAIRAAFRLAAQGGAGATPTDWFRDTTPEKWVLRQSGKTVGYRWVEASGCDPFDV